MVISRLFFTNLGFGIITVKHQEMLLLSLQLFLLALARLDLLLLLLLALVLRSHSLSKDGDAAEATDSSSGGGSSLWVLAATGKWLRMEVFKVSLAPGFDGVLACSLWWWQPVYSCSIDLPKAKDRPTLDFTRMLQTLQRTHKTFSSYWNSMLSCSDNLLLSHFHLSFFIHAHCMAWLTLS